MIAYKNLGNMTTLSAKTGILFLFKEQRSFFKFWQLLGYSVTCKWKSNYKLTTGNY